MPVKKAGVFKHRHIAVCGMNCHLCMAYFSEKGIETGRNNLPCPECRRDDKGKPRSCASCRIKNCPKRIKNKWKYCYECEAFPCARLKNLDKRYRTKYEMSMIENQEYIRDHGIRKFLAREEKRWTKDGKVYCVHHHKYYSMK